MFLIVLQLLPFLTDVSDIIFDKTCWKPWYNFSQIVWYLPLRVTLWCVIYLFFKEKLINYNYLKYLTTILISVIIYTFIKPF